MTICQFNGIISGTYRLLKWLHKNKQILKKSFINKNILLTAYIWHTQLLIFIHSNSCFSKEIDKLTYIHIKGK